MMDLHPPDCSPAKPLRMALAAALALLLGSSLCHVTGASTVLKNIDHGSEPASLTESAAFSVLCSGSCAMLVLVIATLGALGSCRSWSLKLWYLAVPAILAASLASVFRAGAG